jgi:CDP-diacylglycerol--serine O-phosphatidyltransferase
MTLKKYILNLITLLNLLSGCVASVLAVQGDLVWTAVFVAAGIFFDFFDGLAARLLHVKSDLGLQLDSLADMVTSGLVPGLVMCQLIFGALHPLDNQLAFSLESSWLVFVGFFITLGSAYRLAQFNIDERQTASFIGLPTPANALLILSLGLIIEIHPDSFLAESIQNIYFLIGMSILSTFLLNVELKLFALKVSNLNFSENWYRYTLVVISIVGLITLQFVAIPIIILVYILLSVIVQKRV